MTVLYRKFVIRNPSVVHVIRWLYMATALQCLVFKCRRLLHAGSEGASHQLSILGSPCEMFGVQTLMLKSIFGVLE